jgi:flagellar hook-basal body complex protein FliE
MVINSITPVTPIVSGSFVSAINSLQPIGVHDNQVQGKQQQENGGLTFADMLKQIIDNVNTTSAQAATDATNLALGLINEDYLHNIMINAEKADLALRTMVSVRNKVMDAYTEIMRITV